MGYELPELGYAYDALEPHIDARTMEIHHSKHHAAYIAKANAALEGTEFADKKIYEVCSDLEALPADIQGAVRNNGGGHLNHSIFWGILGTGSEGPSGKLAEAIDASFGSLDAMKEEFSNAAATRFGSGWAWLVLTKDGGLAVTSTPNQDNPIMDGSGLPILGLDVWEHAYYLNYQNRRPDYVTAFWNVVNWEAVSANLAQMKECCS